MDLYPTIFSGLIGVLITNLFTLVVLRRREQNKREIDLLEKLLVSDTMLKARLVTQEYLVPGIDRAKFPRFATMGFDDINAKLEGTPEEADRFHIRALTSFFWLVDQAKRVGAIQGQQKLWSRIYSYYWVIVIEPRSKGSPDPMYAKIEWMLEKTDVADRRDEYTKRLRECAIHSGAPAIGTTVSSSRPLDPAEG